MKVSKKMSFAEVMDKNPDAAKVFQEAGMHCISCPMAMSESVEDGCAAHGIDADELVEKLNKAKKCTAKK